MKEFFWKYDTEIKVILFLLLFAVGIDLLRIHQFLPTISQTPQEIVKEETVSVDDKCGEECQKVVEEEVAQAVASISGQKKIVNVITQTKSGPQTTFIPFGGSFSTKNTDWADVKGSEAYIKIEDYGKDAYVDWNAFLKVTNGNGTVFARLYDVTHGIAVDSSEISTSSGDSTLVSSGRLHLWSGNNLYRVQIKSLNSFEVFFDSGRIKIVSGR